MTDPLTNAGYDTKIGGDLLKQKLLALQAASAAKTAQLSGEYLNAVKLREAGLDTPYVDQADILRTSGDVAIKLGQGVVGLGQAAVGLGNLATGGLVGDGMKAIGYNPELLKNTIGEHLSDSQKAADAKVQQSEGFINNLKASLTNPRSILGSVAESTPGMLTGMGVTGAVARGLGTQAAIEAASTRLMATGALTEGAQTAGQIAEQAQAAGREYSDYVGPAIAAGAGTAALGMVSNKIMGDAATDIATGTKTLKGSYGAKLAKEAFSEGVMEELPQSAQEQVFTNIAMGEQDIYKGVGNAAASGLVAGAAMGVGMGSLHKSDNAKAVIEAKKQNTAEKQQTFNTAAEMNDITPFIDPKSKDYDPSRGMQALLGHAMKDTTSPEVKQANLKQAGELLATLEEQHAKAKDEADGWSPDTVKQYKADLAGAVANLKATDPQNTARVAKLTDLRDSLAEQIDYLTDKKNSSKIEKVNATFSRLDRQLKAGRTAMDGLVNTSNPVVTPEAVSTMVDSVNTGAVDAPVAVDQLINLSMIQPGSMTSDQALKLADNPDTSLTTEQRDHLRAFSAARLAHNAVSTTSDVTNEVMFGSKKNLGLSQYRARVAAAMAADNQDVAKRSLDQLRAFATSHAQKTRLALQAFAEAKTTGSEQQLVKTEKDGWKLQPAGTLSPAELTKNGGLLIHKNSNEKGLITNMQKEVAAINATGVEMKTAMALRFGIAKSQGADVQSNPSTNTPSSGNINTPTNEEDTARPELRPELPTTKSTPVVKAVPVVQAADAAKPKQPTAGSWAIDNAKAFVEAIRKSNPKLLTQVEDLHARDMTAGEIATQLKVDTDMVRDLRVGLGLPSQGKASGSATMSIPGDAQEREAFLKWVADRKAKSPAKPEAAQQPAVVSAANPAPVADAATAEAEAVKETQSSSFPTTLATPASESAVVEKTTTLSVFDTTHDNTVPYMEQNLIGTQFKQTAGNKDTSTLRPLAKTVDFLTVWKNKTEGFKLSNYLQQKTAPTPEQRNVLSHFLASALAWTDTITGNLVKSATGYGFQDPIQFLLKDSADGKSDLDENVKTAIAYAAYSWVAENAARPAINDKAEINLILSRDEDALVSSAEENALSHVGTRQNIVVNSLGQRIVASFGLKSLASAPRNVQADLEASLGAHAMKLLLDEGILVRTTITGMEMQVLTQSQDTNTNAKFYFLGLARKDGMLAEKAEAIYQNNKGTHGILDKLFGVESALKEPSQEPIKSTQKTTRNTDQGIPAELKKQVAADDAMPSMVRADMYNLVGQMDPEIMLQIAGKEDGRTAVHKSRRLSIEAKNNGLARELERFMGYVGQMGQDVLMHFEHSVWMQQRVGIATNMINPQTSKIHRNMLYRADWETTINTQDVDAMTNFKLRVAEGLGVKTDKKNKDKALADFAALMATPEIKGAVNVLVKSLEGPTNGKLTDNEQQVLLAGVKAGGEDMHSLSALMALAQYKQALKEGKTSFTSQMMAEVDGVTNGPMLTHLLLGAANDIKEMFALLNRGGFFEQGNAHTEYNNWRDAPGNFDLYENTALHMTQAINAAKHDSATMASLYAFTGELAKDGVVQKAGRNIIKTPLTAMVFGSSVNNAVDSMADNFVDAIYTAIEDGKMGRLDILKHLSMLGVNLSANADLMEHEFTPQQIKTLKGIFKGTLGKAVEDTMKQDFAVFIAQRTEFNKTAQLTFDVYNAVYTGMREAKITELVKSGEMAVNPTTGKPIHDLTNAQEKALRKELEALSPVMNSPMSKESNDLSSGLLVAKSARKLSTDPTYQNTVKFGTPFADGSKSTTVRGYEVTPTGPGVAMVPVSMHSADSAISVRANPEGKALNVHDAQGHGVGGIIDTAKVMNSATWDTMLNYSPAAEITASLLRTVQGLDAMMQAGTIPDGVITKLASTLVDFAVKHEVAPEGVLHLQAELAQGMAYRADSMKLDTLATMQAVNQYAMEGGAFVVTPDNRASAASLRSALAPSLSTDANSALISVGDKLDAAIKAEVAKRDNGKPAKSKVVAESPALKAIFTGKDTAPIDEVITGLRSQLPSGAQNGFQQKLLSVIEKTILKDVTVRLVTSETNPGDLLAPLRENALGAYVSLPDGRHEINLVDSTLSVEVMLHELTHAALARVIANPTEAAKPLVVELEALRLEAIKVAKGKYTEALKDVQEMVAWGMTNTSFQDDVLKQVKMDSVNDANLLVSGMQKFIKNLVQLIFGRPNDNMNKGMAVLISNVSGLFNAAAQNKAAPSTVINQSMAANNLRDLSTNDIYEALSQNNNGATVSVEHNEHLKELLNTIVKSIHGPFGSFKAALMGQTAQDPIDVYTEAQATGKAPFASETLGAGFAFTEQESFVLEQVEASMQAALDSKDGVMTIAYKEMTKLYSEVRAKLTVESFHKGDWATATPTQKAEAQALYDFIFAIKQDASGKSDYMARFAALGLVHSGFREQLQFHTSMAPSNPNMGFNERLNQIFNKIMGWLAGRLTDTYKGQRADMKLNSLVQQIIGIEAKKRNKLEQQNTTLNAISNTMDDVSASAREAIEKFGKLPFFKDSGNAFVKLAGSTLSAVAGDRVDAIMEAYLKLRDKTMTGQLGVAASLVNEVRGATDVNKIYHFLLRATKHLEGQRKDIITHISQAVSGGFVNGGEDLKDMHNKVLTAVVLRGDMQALLGTAPGQYTVAQLHDMVNDRTKVQTEIDAHEAQLTGPMRKFYQSSAEHLGFYLATGKITVAHQLFNAGNIARVHGTGMSKNVSEADAKAMTPIIDRLASLYALKYADRNGMLALREVFDAEAARTDGGHGIEMVMKTHTSLQAESKDKLFAGSETMQMKGYVPEIYDPYMSVVMATDEQGAELELRGYVPMPGYLGQDVADPFSDRKRIYSLRDGGLKQWNSGIFSTTDSRAKGNRVIHGAQSISAAGQQNIANMNAIASGKRAGIQAMFNGTTPKPLQVKATHMAPVLDPNGNVSNYRYMMSNQVKDNLLNRDNRTGKLLGSMAGNTFDKTTSKIQNANAVQALYDQYKADYAEHMESYLTVGPQSSDPQLREIWHMLPRDTQERAKALFGEGGMKVRNDVLDMNFGYRKLSLGTMFDKEDAQRNFVEKMFVEIMSHMFDEKAQLRTRQAEDIWQAVVKEMKANIVVKSWATMTGNLRSNWSQLLLMGVSPLDIVKSHRVAFKAAWEYKQDSAKLFQLKHQLKIGHMEPGNTIAKLEYQVKRLEDGLARNPIRPLIDAGLMPTIVEDVSVDEDGYSYKSRFTKKIDDTVDAINPHILKGVQMLTMHHSTAPYKIMSYATQISDFLARYTLYQHDVTKKNALTHEQAVQRASEAFINYDIPTHRKIQYANDSGLIMFSKYYVRIQKVLARIYKDAPGRVLAMIAAEHMLGDQPTVLDSSFTHHFGNPFSTGALSYFGSLDSVTTVGLVTGPFTTAVYNGQ